MSISALSNVSFRANQPQGETKKVDENKPVQTQNISAKSKDEDVKLTGGMGKAIASFFIPGLGQFLDGRKKAGAIFLGTGLALSAAKYKAGIAYSKRLIQEAGKEASGAAGEAVKEGAKQVSNAVKSSKNLKPLISALAIASLAHIILRTVDAYKGGKSEKKIDQQV